MYAAILDGTAGPNRPKILWLPLGTQIRLKASSRKPKTLNKSFKKMQCTKCTKNIFQIHKKNYLEYMYISVYTLVLI